MDDAPATKVLFRVPDDDGGAIVETLWAIPLGGDRYKLDNSPFFAYGVSWQDVVFAPIDVDDAAPLFQFTVVKSGNRTVRVIFDAPVSPGSTSDQVLQGLVSLGCSYEGFNPNFMSVNIPPGIAMQAVCAHLVQCQVQWEHADPTYESLFSDEA